MNINLPSLINAVIPDDDDDPRHRQNKSSSSTTATRKGGGRRRNVAILSDNLTAPKHTDPSFLSPSFPRNPPKIFIATDRPRDPPASLVAPWQAEGFHVVAHVPLGTDEGWEATLATLHRRAALGPCETYGIVAYGAEAAARVLEYHHVLRTPGAGGADEGGAGKCSAVVAYAPARIPDPGTVFPMGVGVVVHLPLSADGDGVVEEAEAEADS